jgi:hypothetical protein
MHSGKAVLLEEAKYSWIDGHGRIYRGISTGGLVGRDGELFIYEIKDGKLDAVVTVGFNVNIYLQKEGWYEIDGNNRTEISAERGEAMYNEYYTHLTYRSENECTRSLSGIEFTPLFNATTPSQRHIGTFSNLGFSGNILTVSSISDSDISFAFEHTHYIGKFDPATGIEPETHTVNIVGVANKVGNRYSFNIDGITGFLEFGVVSTWLTVIESQNEYLECGSYLFDYPQD